MNVVNGIAVCRRQIMEYLNVDGIFPSKTYALNDKLNIPNEETQPLPRRKKDR